LWVTVHDVVFVLSFVAVCTLTTWAAGYLITTEDVFSGTRNRFEDWAYRDADVVREEDRRRWMEFDLLWDRAQFWRPGAKRGVCSFMIGVKGRKVPHRDQRSGLLLYGVPLLDGEPLGLVGRAGTLARTKTADLVGCPKCSGMWGGTVVALAASHWGPWRFGWLVVVVCQVAGWGLARRIGWSKD
jgi:hypothetical protein